MIERLRSFLFEPRQAQRYIGRHRAVSTYPVLTITVRRQPRAISA